MTEFAADIAQTYDCKSGVRDRIILMGSLTLGSSGAVASQSVDDPQISVTKEAAAGTYTMTFPKALRGFLRVWVMGSATLNGAVVTAFDAGAGTAGFNTQTTTLGTPANGASGNVIAYQLVLDTNK